MVSFSVIIPVFNAEETLVECLESLQKQSLSGFEVIAVDDGSTDGSAEILNDFEKEIDNFIILKQKNKGLGNARNEAIKIANGEWLVFLDADDVWQANKLKLIDQTITQNPEAELVYHPVFEKYADGRMRKRAFVPIQNLDEFVTKGNPFIPSAMAAKKEMFLRFGGFIEDRGQVEDLLLWIRMLQANVELFALNKPLTVYRVGSGVTAKLEDHLQKVENALVQARDEQLINDAQFSTFINRKKYEAARQLQKLGDHKQANVFYRQLKHASLKQRILSIANNFGLAI